MKTKEGNPVTVHAPKESQEISLVTTDLEVGLKTLYETLEASKPQASLCTSELQKVKVIKSATELTIVKDLTARSKSLNKSLDNTRLEATRHIDDFKKQIMATVNEYKVDEALILSADASCNTFARQEEEKKQRALQRIEAEKNKKIALDQIAIISKTAIQSFIDDKIILLGRTYNGIIPSLTLADIDSRKSRLAGLTCDLQPSDYELAKNHGFESVDLTDTSAEEVKKIKSANLLPLKDAIKLFAEKYQALKKAVMDSIDARKKELVEAEKNKTVAPEASSGGINDMIDMLSAEAEKNNSAKQEQLLTSELSADLSAQAQQQSVSGFKVKKKMKSCLLVPREKMNKTQIKNTFGSLSAFFLENETNGESKFDFLFAYFDKCKNSASNPVDMPEIEGVVFVEDIKA